MLDLQLKNHISAAIKLLSARLDLVRAAMSFIGRLYSRTPALAAGVPWTRLFQQDKWNGNEIAMAEPVSSLCFTSAGIGIVLCLCFLVILSPLVLALLRLSFFQSQSAERYIESERYRGRISYSPQQRQDVSVDFAI